jgi:ribonuclease G
MTWYVEEGIGESRALLVEDGEVLAAKLRWPGELFAGKAVFVRLVSKPAGARRGLAVDERGNEILLDRLPSEVTEGQSFGVQITRAPIAERGRFKRAQARAVTGSEGTQDDIFILGEIVRRFPVGLWDDVWQAASAGEIAFAGGTLLFSVTPAMTVIDIDGDLPPRALALAAIPTLARGLRLFDLGGSIAIDFPTLEAKADRKAVDAALEEALADWPHERTAMNGFGLVQLVARLEGPSLLHRMTTSRVGAAARLVLRRAEAVEQPGALQLNVHPAVKAKLKPEWLDELARSTGRQVRIETNPALAIEAGFAQAVPL